MDNKIITVNEFNDRIKKVQNILKNDVRDAVLVFSTECEPAGVRYFTDYWPSFETAGVLIPREGEPLLLIGPESMTYAKARSVIKNIVSVKDFRESSQPDYPNVKLPTWRDVLSQYKVKTLGISGWHMFPHTIMNNIAEVLGNGNILDSDHIIRKLTLIKSAKEQECLRKAAKISEMAFKAVLEKIRPGLTEIQLVGIATDSMLASGAEATGYPVWCCSGENSKQAISRPTHRKVEKGEIIHFSIGAKVDGYSASIGRPVVLGKCPEEIRRFMQAGLDAELLTIELMRAGTAASEIAKKAHKLITDRGYGDSILYGPAHGCGHIECEFPFVETSSQFTLEENMTFMVDIFLAKSNMGLRWEDGIIVKNGAAEELSSYGRQLNIIEV